MPRLNPRRRRPAALLRAVAPLLLAPVAAGCNLVLDIGDFTDAPAGTGGGSSGSGGGGASCSDGLKNGGETGPDCGGPCDPCAAGEGCEVGPDCASKVCKGGTCIAPACDDQVENGDETAVDCGATCGKCGPGEGCAGDADCKSGTCANGACLSTCSDGLKGGGESDVDCGRPASGCAPCVVGKVCDVGGDCESGVCTASVCVSNHVWSNHFAGIQWPRVAVGPTGDVFLGGTLMQTVNVGGGDLVPSGSSDILLARFDPSGKHVWSKRIGDDQDQNVKNIAAGPDGTIAVVGEYSGAFFLGSSLPEPQSGDFFVAKVDGSGAGKWAKNFGNVMGYSASVAVDAAGNVVIATGASGTVTFKGQSVPCGLDGIFVAKFSSSGTDLWARCFIGDYKQYPSHVATDPAGNIFVTGCFRGGIDLGGGTLTTAGGSDAFLVKLDDTGNPLWSKRFGDGEDQRGDAVAADAVGNVILVGGFAGSIDLGGGPLPVNPDGMNPGLFVSKMNADGDHVWSKGYADTGGLGLTSGVDAAGNIIVAGGFTGSVDFGGGPLVSAGSSTDVYLVKFAASGDWVWNKAFGDGEGQRSLGMAASGSDRAVTVGEFLGAIDFGGGALQSVGGPPGEVFIAELRVP